MRSLLRAVFLAVLTAGLIEKAAADFVDTDAARAVRRNKILTGRTVQIDTSFPYYANRSAVSIAEEIRANGYDGVYDYAIRSSDILPELPDELKRRQIAVGLMTLPSLVYWSEEEMAARLPANWRDWLVKFTGHDMDQYRFIGFVSPQYNEWYKQYLGEMLQQYDFDAVTFAEVMYPIFDGPTRKEVFYGDVSETFCRAFQAAAGAAAVPNFTDPNSEHYFRKDTELYKRWADYRSETLNNFCNDLVNGKGGIRERAPKTLFATWTLAARLENGVAKLREWEGYDAAAMVRAVRPDLHFIQTHAPDWADPALPADYVREYREFLKSLREAAPGMTIALQADLGSTAGARRNAEWQKRFYQTCAEEGIAATTYYEFSLRYSVYAEAPKVFEARLTPEGNVLIVFDQRIGVKSAEQVKGRIVRSANKNYPIRRIWIDGNLLTLGLDAAPPAGTKLLLPLGGIADDPLVRFPTSHLPPLPQGPENAIPPGSEIEVLLLP